MTKQDPQWNSLEVAKLIRNIATLYPLWNSLEVAKLITNIATPLVIVSIGCWIQLTITAQDQAWKARERLADRRLDIYDEIREPLNRIYCFVEDVGTFKEETPLLIISYKRDIDRTMHTNRSIWSADTFHAYLTYISTAFDEYGGGVGQDAKIKTRRYEKQNGIDDWHDEWEDLLTDKKDSDHRKNYNALQDLMARDLVLMNVKEE